MRRTGFTLVEMMIVMLVLALAASAVILAAGGARRGPSTDVARLASRIAAARESAITSSRPVSLWVSRSGYGFDVYSRGRWQPASAKPFEPQDWPSGTEVTASGLAGQGAMIAHGQTRLTFDNLGVPEAPLTVRLARDGNSASLTVAGNGDVVIG
jgi:general secretion pathway protein H